MYVQEGEYNILDTVAAETLELSFVMQTKFIMNKSLISLIKSKRDCLQLSPYTGESISLDNLIRCLSHNVCWFHICRSHTCCEDVYTYPREAASTNTY